MFIKLFPNPKVQNPPKAAHLPKAACQYPFKYVMRWVLKNLWKRAPASIKVFYDTYSRPHYAFGVYWAARNAQVLGIDRISVIEFGVAGGNGLIALEEIAEDVEKETGIQIDVYGFDSGKGMPETNDYRDNQYLWKPGFFQMDDENALRQKLNRSSLVIGDVAQTIGEISSDTLAPIGFVSFDLDYYSSTVSAFKIFDLPHTNFLPRTLAYFDDCIGDNWELHSEYTGELLAISEFNVRNKAMKLAKIHGLHVKRLFPSWWNEVMFVHHRFEHPLYNELIHGRKDWQMPLGVKLSSFEDYVNQSR